MAPTEKFLLAMLIVFVVPWLFWRLCRTDYVAPLVVVQIVTGIVLGPGVAGAAFPGYFAFVFAPPVIAALNGIAWWAVMMFVWVAGIELDLRSAWKHRQETVLTATLALASPLVAGCLAAAALLAIGGAWIGSGGREWQFVLGIGMACAVTAMPILVLLMEKLEVLRLPLGQRILRYASLDDVAIWSVLALILLDWQRLGRQAGFLLLFPAACWLYHRLMPRLNANDRWFAGLVWLIACGFAADWCGLHFMVGAFLAGAVTESAWFDQAEIDRFRGTVLTTLMPVFFLSTGLRTSWAMGGAVVFGSAALLLLASVAGKLAGTHLAGRLLGWRKGEATLIGWLLQTKALIMIIFVNILLDKAIITSQTFTALLIMAVASTMLTIPIVAPRLKRQAELLHAAS
ncbi:MAG: cation:proton antiporter [Sphingomonadales bacterium]|nr:cation:proton antiporter [Sphingomonadales bacterium]